MALTELGMFWDNQWQAVHVAAKHRVILAEEHPKPPKQKIPVRFWDRGAFSTFVSLSSTLSSLQLQKLVG